jgi:hypothetical protein
MYAFQVAIRRSMKKSQNPNIKTQSIRCLVFDVFLVLSFSGRLARRPYDPCLCVFKMVFILLSGAKYCAPIYWILFFAVFLCLFLALWFFRAPRQTPLRSVIIRVSLPHAPCPLLHAPCLPMSEAVNPPHSTRR